MTDQNFEQLAQEFKKQVDNVKAIAEEYKGKMEHNDKITAEAKAQADEALTKLNETKAQLGEMEQKLARRPSNGDHEIKSGGREFIESAEYKSAVDNEFKGIYRRELKNTIGTAEAAGNIQPTNLGLILPNQQRLTIRDLLAGGKMGGNTLEYVQEAGFTNNAAVVGEGESKPESAITFEDKDAKAVVIAHWLKVTTQMLSDAPALESYINNRLRHGLDIKLENQILKGDGTSGNMEGLLTQATAYSAPANAPAGTNMFDVLRFAMLQVVLADDYANGHVLNPIDWAIMETTKDENGRYLIGDPQSKAVPTLWGLPVVQTQAMDVGSFLTGAFNTAAQYFERWGAAVQIGLQNDDFTKNKRTILAETRGALAVYRPESLIYGTYIAQEP
ncbi:MULTISPECIES: phage major capsid protein [unclassified Acinetobacter]|uniref:phage major capsid protein n=1 Tax=unclassified Acinetobacter TaxID=196816 RepID=UPI0015D25B16|nr:MULTISPECIES: phage major capsid protein [unclassified Acinetobacter]